MRTFDYSALPWQWESALREGLPYFLDHHC